MTGSESRARVITLAPFPGNHQSVKFDDTFGICLLNNYAGLPHDEMDVKGRAAVDRALQIDPLLGEAHTSLANLKNRSGDYEGAEAAFKRALELNPNYASAYQWYAEMLADRTDRVAEALDLSQKALTLDPLSPIINVDRAEVLERAGQIEEALALYEKAIQIDPEFGVAYRQVGDLYIRVFGRLDEAIFSYTRSNSIEPDNTGTLLGLAKAYMDLGDFVAADVVRHSGATPGVVVTNISEFKAFLENDFAAVPDSIQEIDIIFGGGDFVAMRARYIGTQTGPMGKFPASNNRLELPFIGILRLEKGRVAEIWVEWDNLNALNQLGHFPPLE